MDSSRENVIEYLEDRKILNHYMGEFEAIKSLPKIVYCKKCKKEVPREDVIRYKGKWYCKSCYIQLDKP